jgi:aminoglycoside 3-N-acetyltransferase
MVAANSVHRWRCWFVIEWGRRRMAVATVTRTEIVEGLQIAGVELGDTLMVHSSMKSFGHVDGGPEAVIDALLDAVGAGGHVVMPTLTATYKRKGTAPDAGLAFNPKTTPSRVGLITDRFWRRPNAVRSEHPTHSVACIGPRASDWMAGHAETSTFGWDGPYGKYVHSDGESSKLVFLGVNMSCNTTWHAVEDWLALPYMATSTALVEQNGKMEEVGVTMAPLGCRGFYRANDRLHQMMVDTGRIRQGRSGDCEIAVMDARFCVGETVRLELAHPGILLCDRPNCGFCTEGRDKILSIQDQIRARAEAIRERGLCS